MKKLFLILIPLFFISCAPTVKVEAPDKPVEINMNINIKHEINVKVDKKLESVMEDNEDIF
ncbi:MAG: YnbE family lipoprotein [Deltaproteobacteria bacterium]|jgi:hypothetical protein|nr:MAG: YnbE family lipoprotein [Deltaproteobacteria bacterium]